MPRQGGHQVAQNSTSTTLPCQVLARAGLAVEVGEGERGQRGDLRPCPPERPPRARLVLPAGQDQLDHAREVGAEALVARRALQSGA